MRSYQLLLTNFRHTLWTTTPSYNLLFDRQTIWDDSSTIDQVLVQWEASPPKEATWENVTDLADKIDFEEGRDVTHIDLRQTTQDSYLLS